MLVSLVLALDPDTPVDHSCLSTSPNLHVALPVQSCLRINHSPLAHANYNRLKANMAQSITLEQGRTAVKAALAGLESEKAELDKFKAEAAGNLMVLLQKVMPKVISIMGPIIGPMGFTQDQPGMMQFMTALNPHNDDPEIKQGKAAIMAAMAGK